MDNDKLSTDPFGKGYARPHPLRRALECHFLHANGIIQSRSQTKSEYWLLYRPSEISLVRKLKNLPLGYCISIWGIILTAAMNKTIPRPNT